MGRDRIHLPGLPRDAARVLIAEIEALKDEQARLRRKAGRAGIVTSDYSVKAGEFVNVEPRSGTLVTITLPESTPALRGARVTLAFRNSNDVRIVAVQGTVNGEAFVINDRPGTYDATADGLGGWFVQVGVSDAGSGAGGGGGGGGFTPTFDTPVDVGLANAEGVSTDLARADHVHRDRIPTASEDGFLERRIYVNAASALVGTTIDGITVQSAPTWNSDADVPDGGRIEFWGVGAGGGGSSGSTTQTSATNGTGGGGGASPPPISYSRADVLAQLPLTFTIALGATGGAGFTVTGSQNANFGNNATLTSVGSLFTAGGGGGGKAPNVAGRAGGGGGGVLGNGSGGDTVNNASVGGDPVGSSGADNGGFGGAGSENTGTTTASHNAIHGGGSGGTAGGPTGASAAGGSSRFGAGGGGASGGTNTVGPVVNNSTAGGSGGAFTRGGGGAAGATSTTGTAGNGSPGATGVLGLYGGDGGGAGGSSVNSGSGARTGGNGGNGGFPGGGGGGGGGAAQNGGSNKTAGSGGNGGDAVVVVTFYQG